MNQSERLRISTIGGSFSYGTSNKDTTSNLTTDGDGENDKGDDNSRSAHSGTEQQLPSISASLNNRTNNNRNVYSVAAHSDRLHRSSTDRNSIDSTTSEKFPTLQPHQKFNFYIWKLTFFAAIGGFLFGYDTGVVSGAMLLLKVEFNLSSFWQELIVSVTIGGAFLSALVGGVLNDLFGRKAVTILASCVFTVGAVVLCAAQNKDMLVAGRLILGFGIGEVFFFF